MSPYVLGSAIHSLTLIALLGLSLLEGCHSSGNSLSAGAKPKIEFTSVPLVGTDNPEKLSSIKGRVIGAQPGQQIVLYARGQTIWWVQPFANQPFTHIQANSSWSSSTHPGSEYAALLVGSDFHPPLTSDVLPTKDVIASAVARGETPFWQKWWFPPMCVMAGVIAILGLHRLRLHQISKKMNLRFEERLAERTRVAQELHDTLLQGILSASMQLHVAIDGLPEDSPAKPALNRVLQLIGQVIDEGRNTLRGLRSSVEDAHDLQSSFSQIPQELGTEQRTGFRVIVEGSPLPLCSSIRDEVYWIGREAVVNALRHSGANSIDVELEYAASHLRVFVSDDGRGIDPKVLQTGRDGHWGLSGMRERAERIGAKLKVLSRTKGGTEVELRVPSDIAFESHAVASASKWLQRFRRNRQAVQLADKRRVG